MRTPPKPPKTAGTRQAALIEINIRWLCQALELVNRLDDDAYTRSPQGLAPHRAGAHLRHVLEFYECFLNGLESFHIDYDARPRNEAIENSRAAASAGIRLTIQLFQLCPELRGESIIWVRMEEAEGAGIRDCFMESSISRELQVLSSHTIHHFALIAITLKLHGVEMDPEFGVAPSSLRYLASIKAEAA